MSVLVLLFSCIGVVRLVPKRGQRLALVAYINANLLVIYSPQFIGWSSVTLGRLLRSQLSSGQDSPSLRLQANLKGLATLVPASLQYIPL